MSDMKHDALVSQGIDIVERVADPRRVGVPPDAHVEMEAKKAAGYYTPEPQKPGDVANTSGRPLGKKRASIVVAETAAEILSSAPGRGCVNAPMRMLALGADRCCRTFASISASSTTTADHGDRNHARQTIRRSTYQFHSRWRWHFETSTASTLTGTRSTHTRQLWPSAAERSRRGIRPRHRQRAPRRRRRATSGVSLDPVSGEKIGRSEGLALSPATVMFSRRRIHAYSGRGPEPPACGL